jgi:hypothetical protein
LPNAPTWQILGCVRTSTLAPLAVLLALVLPGAANAATRCVPVMAPGCDASYGTIGTAVAGANSDDTIRIAAGNYVENVDAGAKRLNFVGAGAGTLTSDAGATVIAPASGAALSLPSGGSVTALKAKGGHDGAGVSLVPTVDGSYSYAITDTIGIGGPSSSNEVPGGAGLRARSDDGAKLASVTVVRGAFNGADPPQSDGPGAAMTGSGLTFAISGAVLQGGSTGVGTALNALGGSDGTVTTSVLRGRAAVLVGDGRLNLIRDRVLAQADGNGGTRGIVAESFTAPTEVDLADSLVVVEPKLAAFDAFAVQAEASSSSNLPVTVNVRGSTLIATGVDPEAAVEADRNTGSGQAHVFLVNSVARLLGPAEADEGDLVGKDGQSITAGNSSFSGAVASGGGSVSAPGSGTNLAGDPLLEADFSLQPSSPLIDRGDPAIVGPGELDLAGAARSQDGNGDCSALPDIGAFERPALNCPNSAPALSSLSMSNKVFAPVRKGGHITAKKKRKVKRGTRFRYKLSEPAKVSIVIERKLKGRTRGKGKKRKCVKPTKKNRKAKRCTRYKRVTTLRATRKAGKQSTAFTGRVKGKALKPGKYRARLRATDSQGAKSKERRLAFHIVHG